MRVLVFILLSFSCFTCLGNTDTVVIKNHLTKLTKTPSYRNHQNIEQLNAIANYIKTDFLKYSDSVSFQEYEVEGKVYKKRDLLFWNSKLSTHYYWGPL